MFNRKSASFKLFIRRIFRRLETVFFLAKDLLSERNFIYLASVVVAISCALAVIVLKSFAHNVFIYANYANSYLKLPFANSLFPIFGILLTVFVVKKFLDGSIEKGSSRIFFSVAI
jgi:CIC family chloride channel protein